mmetsp:Transcript_31169/g.47685  ORF Transcript_31169/g.47685 Transcript_31169/m.47685 type:complete len:200 (+) Transcript_31169:695-1294(+)
MKPSLLFNKGLSACLAGFLLSLEVLRSIMRFPDPNPMKQGAFVGGKRNVAVLEDLNLEHIRQVAHVRQNRAFDVMLALVSTSLFDYFQHQKFLKRFENKPYRFPDSMLISIPFSFREGVVDMERVNLSNRIIGVPLDLPILEHFDQALDRIGDLTKGVKESFVPYSWLFLTRILANLPEQVRDPIQSFFCRHQVMGVAF